MKNKQQEVLHQIYDLVEENILNKEQIKSSLEYLFTSDINVNQSLNKPLPSLLFLAMYYASWDWVNYFLKKGADIYYKVDYKNHKQIDSIAFAKILLEEIKNNDYKEAKEELKNINRLEDGFEKGVPEAEITMQEFYAIKQQAVILEQVFFIEEFARKYKNINYYEFGYWGYDGGATTLFTHEKSYTQEEFENIIIESSVVAYERIKHKNIYEEDNFIFFSSLSEYIPPLLSEKYGFTKITPNVRVVPCELAHIRLVHNTQIEDEGYEDNEEIIIKIGNALQKIR